MLRVGSAAALCAFWFLFFAGMGLLFPYGALYLRENAGLAAGQVGLVLAVPPLVGLVAQPAWGQLADRTGARARLLALLASGSAVALLVFSRLSGFPALLVGMAFLACFHSAVVPSLTAVSLGALGGARTRYFGFVRAWGTVGFLCLVAGFPLVLDRLQARRGLIARPDGPSEPGLEVMYVAAAVLCLGAAVVGLALPRGGDVALRSAPGRWRVLLGHAPFRRLLVVFFGAFLFLHGPTVFFPVYIRSIGGSLSTVSVAWLYMLALEIPLVMGAGLVLARIDARLLLAIGLISGGLRWIACGLIDELALVQAIQLLHGVTVAGLLMGGPLYVEAAVPRELRSTGQGVLSMTGAGVGGVLSSVVMGVLLDHHAAPVPYAVAGACGVLLGLATPLFLPRPQPPSP